MTPFEIALSNDLSVEGERFFNQWIFKWYSMTYQGGKTDVEDFRGGRISYAGIKFGYQQQQIYWQAINRYLVGKVHETFQRWEVETKSYPTKVRLESIAGVERTLGRFVASVTGHALQTDARLRNISDTNLAPTGGGRAGQEITQLAQAHRKLLEEEIGREAAAAVPESKPVAGWLEKFHKNNQGLIWLVKGLIALGIGTAGYILWLFRWVFG